MLFVYRAGVTAGGPERGRLANLADEDMIWPSHDLAPAPHEVVPRKVADLAIPLHFDVAWLRGNRSRLLRKLLDAFPAAGAAAKVRPANG